MTSYSIEKSGSGFVVKANGENVLKTKTLRMANKVVAEVRAAEMKEKQDGDVVREEVKHSGVRYTLSAGHSIDSAPRSTDPQTRK